MGPSGMSMNLVWTGYFLAGIPIILGALYATFTRSEALVWIYFYYQVLTAILVTIVLVQVFLETGACGGFSEIFRVGSAFACGIARASNYLIVILSESVQFYAIHVVWSYLEDMVVSGPELSDLLVDEASLFQKRKHDDPLMNMVGFAEYQNGDYGSIYDLSVDGGVGGGSRIFNGSKHELQYPPPKGFQGA